MTSNKENHPIVFIIFGATGDLAQRKIIPALLSLYDKGFLPKDFKILAFSRRDFTDQEFREFLRSSIRADGAFYRPEMIHRFFSRVQYVQGLFDSGDSYENLKEKLYKIDTEEFKTCSNKLFHLSTPPHLYKNILEKINSSGLFVECVDGSGWTRILVEKPFGNNTEEAKVLDASLGELFKEDQVFRIDHYLAKETVQNILAFRQSNPIFNTLWSSEFIDRVDIKLREKNGVKERGAFYDKVGALKDVGQNHLLQMLALVAMEIPKDFDRDAIRKNRAKIFKNILLNKKKGEYIAVKGQYEGYKDEAGVSESSSTETYFYFECSVDVPRWKSTIFSIESGKMMGENLVEIVVYFRPKDKNSERNILTFRIQPEESIKLDFFVKKPGLTNVQIEKKTLDFAYSSFGEPNTIPDAYERVLNDCVLGDQMLFASTEEIISAWKIIEEIEKVLKNADLHVYSPN